MGLNHLWCVVVGEYGDHLTLIAASECTGACINVVTAEVPNTPAVFSRTCSAAYIESRQKESRPQLTDVVQAQGVDQHFEPRHTVTKRTVYLIHYPLQKHFDLATKAAGTELTLRRNSSVMSVDLCAHLKTRVHFVLDFPQSEVMALF